MKEKNSKHEKGESRAKERKEGKMKSESEYSSAPSSCPKCAKSRYKCKC